MFGMEKVVAINIYYYKYAAELSHIMSKRVIYNLLGIPARSCFFKLMAINQQLGVS